MNKKATGGALVFLFALTYMTSYITRINYDAIIAEMVRATGYTKDVLSLSLTGMFIAYGSGQILSGLLADRFSPKRLVTIGLSLSTLMNIAVPLCNSPYIMLICWCINGLAQAFMWPPLVKLLTSNFEGHAYKNAVTKVSWGSSIGTIVIYLVAPLVISIANWKWVFWFSAAAAIIMIAVWNLFCPEYSKEPLSEAKEETEAPQNQKSGAAVLFNPLMIFVMLAIVLQGMLRDGVTTWMPSYISETYNLGTEIAILTGVVLPIFSIICFAVTGTLHRKWLRNPLVCAGFIFAIGTAAAVLLYFFTNSSVVLSVALSAILTASMHGVNLMLICMLPDYFKKFGKVSTISGILNSCTYIGSSISTYGIALISEKAGWNFTLLVWFLIALTGTVICFAAAKPWTKKMGE